MVGDTDWEPEVAVEPVQLLGVVALQEVALEEDHVRVEELPELMVVGLAVRVTVGGLPELPPGATAA